MGIALLSAARFVESVPVWFQRFWPEVPSPESGTRPVRKQRAGGAPHLVASAETSTMAPRKPLRVLRVVDAQQPGSGVGAGRMVISGRMADVCAELDRLAAAEALQSAGSVH